MPDPVVTADRWHKRPALARAYRVYAMAGPLLALFCIALLAAQVLPSAAGTVSAALRWALVGGLALSGALVAERTLRRLLPIAALLDLDLGFPGAVPSRARVASFASLRGRDAELADVLPELAGSELDAAAEHVLVTYASTARTGLRPRSHAARVRAVATLVADRLDLGRDDRDRLQWALLLRELGTGADGQPHPHPHQHVVAWLGPWSALLRGPFIDVATNGAPSAVATGAHAAAVADAYVVVTAAHPYERSLDGGSRLPLEAFSAERLSPTVVEALLRLSVPARRRAAGFTSGVPSRLLRYTPSPQPVFALASLAAVVVFGAGGVGTGPTLPADVTAGAATAAAAAPATLAFPPVPGDTAVVEAVDREQDVADDAPPVGPRRKAAPPPREPADRASYLQLSAPVSSASGGQRTGATGGPAPRSTSSGSPSETATGTPSSTPSPKPTPSATPTPGPGPSPTPAPDPTPGPGPTDPAPAPAPAPDPGATPGTGAEPAPAPSP